MIRFLFLNVLLASWTHGAYAQDARPVELLASVARPIFHYGQSSINFHLVLRAQEDPNLRKIEAVFLSGTGELKSVQANFMQSSGPDHQILDVHTMIPVGSFLYYFRYVTDQGMTINDNRGRLFRAERTPNVQLYQNHVQLIDTENHPTRDTQLVLVALNNLAYEKTVRLHLVNGGSDPETIELNFDDTIDTQRAYDANKGDAELWVTEVPNQKARDVEGFYLSYKVGGQTFIDDNYGAYYQFKKLR